MSRSEPDVKHCSPGVVLPTLFFGIPVSITLVNFGASFLGYAVMLALGIAPNPAAPPGPTSAPPNSTSAPPNSTFPPNVTFPFLNGTINTSHTINFLSVGSHSTGQSTGERHPICGQADLNVTSAIDFATMTALGTAIAFMAYSIFATIYTWYYSKDAKETASTARSHLYGAMLSNLVVGPVAGGLVGFTKYCMPIVAAAEMMGAPFFGLLVFAILASFINVAHSLGKKYAEKQEEPTTVSNNPSGAYEMTPVEVISHPVTSPNSPSLELQQRDSLRSSRESGSGTFNMSPATSPKSRSPQQRRSFDAAADDDTRVIYFDRRSSSPAVFRARPPERYAVDSNTDTDTDPAELPHRPRPLGTGHARNPTQEFKENREAPISPC